MKKQIDEADFIGGQGPLTKEEEIALAEYFASKKGKEVKQLSLKSIKAKLIVT